MKILFIHNKYKQYGGEDVAVKLETAVLIRNGHDVKTIIYDNRTVTGLFSKIFTGLRSLYNFAAAKDLSKTILSFRPDVIHI